MNIAIDCSKAINESAGVARYTREIAQNMPEIYRHDHFLYLYNFFKNRQEKDKLIQNIGDFVNVENKIFHIPGGVKEVIFSSNFSILNYILKNCEIYHAPDFLSFDRGLKIPQVLTVHDLTMVKFPKHLGGRLSSKHTKKLKTACFLADKIIAVSSSTKNDLIKLFGINPLKIETIHLGADKKFIRHNNTEIDEEKLLKKYNINFPFILFVGTIEPRKNIKNLILAFEKFNAINEKNPINLVLVGKKGWNNQAIFDTYNKSSCKKKIHFIHDVTDDDLVSFYNCAKLFCYPSIYEGFGLPVLEAMSCGAPTMTSSVSSMPEIGGKAAYYINPYSIDEISAGFQKIIINTKLASKMSSESQKQASNFSWRKNIEKTHKLYYEISRKIQ